MNHGLLQVLTDSPDSNKSEIEKLVGAASRSFSVLDEAFDFPGIALGYSEKPTKPQPAGKLLN